MSEGPESVYSVASRKKKWLATLAIYYCNIGMGINMTFLNPTMLDFEKKLGEDVDDLAVAFTILTASYLAGALVGGLVLPFLKRQYWIVLCLALQMVPFTIIPFINTKILLFVLTGVMGFGGGGYDCAQVAWVIDIWRHQAAPFILTQHFAYSLGTLVPPLLLAPFLTEKVEDKEDDGLSTTPFTTSTELPYESKLATPFLIASGLLALSVLIQLGVWFMFRSSPEKSENVDTEKKDLEKTISVVSEDLKPVGKQDSLRRQIYLVFLCCCVIGFYQGLELCTGQFLPTFSHFSEVGLSEADGARVSFGMQMGFAVGRFAGILLVLRIAPQYLISGSFIILLGANTILLVLGGSNVTWLWAAAVVLGLGMSTVYPALYAYVEKYIFVTDRIAAVVTVAGGLVSAIYPLIVSGAITDNPEMMTYVNYLSIVVCVAAFSVLFWVTHVRARRLGKSS